MSERARVTDYIFHWKFWAPVDCIGGSVYFGGYYKLICDGKETLQTVEQVRIKRQMGFIE